MATGFTPPKLSQHEGPDPHFTPPPLSAHEGPDVGFTPPPLSSEQGKIPPPRGFFGEAGQFFSTLGPLLKSLPTQALEFASSHPLQSMWDSAGAKAERAKEAIANKDYSTALGYTLAGVLGPLGVGDLAAQAGEEFGAGNPGAGLANATVALGPAAFRATPYAKQAATTTGKAIQGGTLGGMQAFTEAKKTQLPALLGSATGYLMGGREGAMIGGALGAAPNTIRGAVQGIREALAPQLTPPPEATPFTPFEVKPSLARLIKNAPISQPDVGMPTGTGANRLPRGRWKPAPQAEPTPAEPKAPEPFKPNPATARKMKYGGPTEPDFSPGKPVGPTGWSAPTEPMSPGMEPPPAPEPPPPFQKFEVKQSIKQRIRSGGPSAPSYGPSRSGPAKRTGINRAMMPKPPAEEEGVPGAPEGTTVEGGVAMTPAMREAIVQQELAKRGLPSKMTPPPSETAAPPAPAPKTTGVNIPQKEGRPPRYAALQAQAAGASGEMYHAKDLRVMQKLQAKGITKEQWRSLTDEQKNAYIKAAGEREFKGEPRGFSRGAAGMRWLDEMFEDQ